MRLNLQQVSLFICCHLTFNYNSHNLLLTDIMKTAVVLFACSKCKITVTHSWHPPPTLTALLLRWEHSKCHSSLLFQPGAVPAGPSAGGVAEGQSGTGDFSATGWPAGIPHCWWLPGHPVPLWPRTRHGGVQFTPPALQVIMTQTHVGVHQFLLSWFPTCLFFSVI